MLKGEKMGMSSMLKRKASHFSVITANEEKIWKREVVNTFLGEGGLVFIVPKFLPKLTRKKLTRIHTKIDGS